VVKIWYENVLRVYDLLNPVMSSPEVGLPLNDRTIWTQPVGAQMLKAATSAEGFESFGYMPVTRALSAGKRKLLHRWCDLVIQGALPPDNPAPLADEDVAPQALFSKLA
jgi:hypothetical protein